MIVVRITGHLLTSVSKLRELKSEEESDGMSCLYHFGDCTDGMVDRTFEISRHYGVNRPVHAVSPLRNDGALSEEKTTTAVISVFLPLEGCLVTKTKPGQAREVCV